MNNNELQVKAALEGRGFKVLRNGWPDFLCLKPLTGDRVGLLAVEVKTHKDRLSEEQKAVHSVLKSARIPVYVLRPGEELRKLSSHQLITKNDIETMERQVIDLEWKIKSLVSTLSEVTTVLNSAKELIPKTSFILEPSNAGLKDVGLPEPRLYQSEPFVPAI